MRLPSRIVTALVLFSASLVAVEVSAAFPRATIASASIPAQWRRQSRRHSNIVRETAARKRRTPLFSAGWKQGRSTSAVHDPYYGGGAVQLVARRSPKTTSKEQDEAEDSETSAEALTYSDLPLAGKIVAGFVEIAVVTALDYISGFLGAYALGSVWGLPGLALGDRAVSSAPTTFWQGASRRMGRMHQRSTRWAKTWGGVSAAVGGISVAARVVRGGKEDEWTSVLSSMAIGAYFFRNEGPVAMAKGALLYGAIVKLFSIGGGGSRVKQPPPEFQDEELVVD